MYEPALDAEDFYRAKIIKDIEESKYISHLIIANRYSSELEDVREKLYTRDLYHRD